MESECTQYRHRIEQAAGAETLALIEHEYQLILDERRKVCRYPGPRDRPILHKAMLQVGLAAR